MATIDAHGRILDPRLFVIPELDAFEGTFAEKVDDVVVPSGEIRSQTISSREVPSSK